MDCGKLFCECEERSEVVKKDMVQVWGHYIVFRSGI